MNEMIDLVKDVLCMHDQGVRDHRKSYSSRERKCKFFELKTEAR